MRDSPNYKTWRDLIFRRDQFTCRKCSVKGKYLEAHHISNWADNKDDRFKTENGVTLCGNCHESFHIKYGKGKNTREQLKEFGIETEEPTPTLF